MYCTRDDHQIVSLDLEGDTDDSREFVDVVQDDVEFLHFFGDDVFATKDGSLVRKGAGQIKHAGNWESASDEKVRSVVVFGDGIYGVDANNQLVSQRYFAMNKTSKWVRAGKGGITATAL